MLVVLYKKGIITDKHLRALKRFLTQLFGALFEGVEKASKKSKVVEAKMPKPKKVIINPPNMSKILTVFKWFVMAVLILIGIKILNPFVNVEAGHRGIVFDKLQGGVQEETLMEGLHFRVPFFQSITQLPVRTQKLIFIKESDRIDPYFSYEDASKLRSPMSAASSDLQDVYIEAVVTYHLDPENVQKVFQEIGTDYESKKIIPSVMDSVKTFTAKYKVSNILTERADIKKRVFDDLKAALEKDNIILEDVDLTNFDFDPNYKAAIEQKQIEEQKAQKEEYILKQKEIQVQQIIKSAEADKQAKVLEGEGIAEYNKLIQQEITSNVLEYKKLENARLAIEKWGGAYPQTYFGAGENSPIPLINLQK